MKISLVLTLFFIAVHSFSQNNKAGTITVAKSTVSGIYLYESSSEQKTYIRIFSDSSVMMANNNGDLDYMDYWFTQMARNSNLPKGKLEFNGDKIVIELKIAQSKEDNIILNGMFIDNQNMKLHRVGEGYDNKDYIFIKQK
jgi:hypothetical protein